MGSIMNVFHWYKWIWTRTRFLLYQAGIRWMRNKYYFKVPSQTVIWEPQEPHDHSVFTFYCISLSHYASMLIHSFFIINNLRVSQCSKENMGKTTLVDIMLSPKHNYQSWKRLHWCRSKVQSALEVTSLMAMFSLVRP